MRTLHIHDALPVFKNPVVTIGTFDGVHLGHQKIVREIVNLSRKIAGDSIIITFWPHPRHLLQGEQSVSLLHTLEEKKGLLEKLGVDYLIVVPFSRTFSELTAEEYITDFLVARFHPRMLVIGYDHRFGKNRMGDFSLLQKWQTHFNYSLLEIPRESLEDAAISSTKIRQALSVGDIHLANSLLGYSYSLSGIVGKGDQLGRKLGFPTANVIPDNNQKMIPCPGVYAVRAEMDSGLFPGVMNIGYRPTINGKDMRIEVHLFSFNSDIYGKSMRVNMDAHIRQEKRFESVDDLKSAITKDCAAVKKFYKIP